MIFIVSVVLQENLESFKPTGLATGLVEIFISLKYSFVIVFRKLFFHLFPPSLKFHLFSHFLCVLSRGYSFAIAFRMCKALQ